VDGVQMREQKLKQEVAAFDRDASGGEGYVYTIGDRLSTRLATGKLENLILQAISFEGKRVADIGCGDGHFTRRFWDRGNPSFMAGIDPAANAIQVANAKRGDRNIDFEVGNGHALPWPDGSFDLAVIEGVLHHDDEPWSTIREAFRVAPNVVILEPNGYNMGLKVIEKVSSYHREHAERSYPPMRLKRWIREAGGTIVSARYGGFVPMFAPDLVARAMKAFEPLVERMPVLQTLASAVIVVVARRT
jgi:ubiquinone/menaquinone biosynthesis C-methylase UbiE